MEQRVAVVTGGCRGIGLATARAFLASGYRVAVADAAPVDTEGALVISCDVADWAQVEAMARTVSETYGRIDVLINNAGIGGRGSFYTAPLEHWHRVLAVDLTGAYLCARACAPVMKAGGGGAIVNIASTRALMSEPDSEPYAASKGGLLALTHALAVTLGPDGIRVNAISPGWIDTTGGEGLRPEDHRQHPAGRVGRPADIARACLFLCDPANSFLAGQNLVIDGGMTVKMIYS
jgi:NAD(P)-dependent dehydrogenase (short-subunit alcohol dehydrogenase family)